MGKKLFFLFFLISKNQCSHEIISLLDQIYETQAYWQQCSAYYSVSIIKKNINLLEKQKKQLILLLYEHISKNKTFLAKKDFLYHKKLLKSYKPPSYILKNWKIYTFMSSFLFLFLLYLSYFQKHYILFVIDPKAPSLLSALQNNSPFLGHDYVNDNGQQYLQVKKEQEKLARNFLESKNISFSLAKPNKILNFYNEKGINYFWEFFDIHGIQPSKKIIKIIKNENPTELPLLSTDPQADQLMFEKERLDPLLKMAFENEITSSLVKNILKNKKLEELSFPEKNILFTRLFLFVPEKGSEQLVTIFKEFRKITESSAIDTPLPDVTGFKKINEASVAISIAKKLIETIAKVSDENSEMIKLASHILTLRIQQRELQLSAAIHQINMFAERARLNLEISTMIPLFLTSYGCYKFIYFLYKKIKNKNLLKIKKDLISFELLLNEYRYKTDTIEYQGFCYYWTSKLLRYIPYIKNNEKIKYQIYIEKLQNKDFSPDQKLTLIDCIHKEFSFI